MKNIIPSINFCVVLYCIEIVNKNLLLRRESFRKVKKNVQYKK